MKIWRSSPIAPDPNGEHHERGPLAVRVGRLVRRAGVALGGSLMVVVLTGGTVSAYHCYIASASEQGSAGMGSSPAFYTLEAVFTDLCGATSTDATAIVEELIVDPDGSYLNDYDDSLWDVQISVAAHMAGGLEFWYSPNAEQLWHDSKGVDHLGTDLESFLSDVYAAAWKVASLNLDTCE